MGLGTNRDYTTRERRAMAALNVHENLMGKYVAEGLGREAASERAYREIMNGEHRKEIRSEEKRLLNLRKGRTV